MRRRKRYLDNTAPADNTANVVRPVIVRRDENIKARSPERQRVEQQKARYVAERNQRISSTFARTPAGRRAANRAYAIESQKAKQEAAKEEAAAVVGSLFKPLMPSTYVDMAAAIKNGQVNNLTDALAAPYLSDSWSMRNPGKALALDIALPVVAGVGTKIINRGTRGLRLSRAYEPVKSTLITDKNYKFVSDAEWDAAYNQALNNKNVDELQRLRDLHFEAKSGVKPEHWYHGTKRQFNSLDPYAEQTTFEGSGGTTFLANEKQVAKEYGDGPTGRILDLYPNIKNPKIIDYKGAAYTGNGTTITYVDPILNQNHILYHPNGTKYFPFGYYEGPESTNLLTRKLEVPVKDWGWVDKRNLKYNKEHVTLSSSKNAEQAIEEGYDAALLKNIVEGVYKNRGINLMNNDLAIRNTKLLKSAEPITYDNAGNIIPLSKRDNFNINDLRYSWLLPFLIGGGVAAKNK